MIRKARRSFICFTMCILSGILLVPMIALNAIPAVMAYNEKCQVLEQAVESEIRLRTATEKPEKPPEKPEATTAATTQQTTLLTTINTSTVTTVTTTSVTEEKQQTKAVTQAAATTKETTAATVVPSTEPPQMTRETTPPMTKEPQVTGTYLPPNDWWHPEDDKPDYDKPDWRPESPRAVSLSAWNGSASLSNIIAGIPHDDRFPREEAQSAVSYFMISLDADGVIQEVMHTEEEAYSTEALQKMVTAVRERGDQDGCFETLQYYLQQYDKGEIVAFADRSEDVLFLRQLITVSVIVFVLMEIIVLILTMLLTKRAMQPMQISFEKQKQFISDAGHELKTPLTIISANADILQDEIGESKWLDYIRMQTQRMRVLVDEMMALTKMEHADVTGTMERFNLSSAVETMALPFESQAFEQQKAFQITVQPDLYFTGNPEQIRRMIGIFIDNAFKYSAENGEIKVSLQETNGRSVLEVYNTGKGIRPDEKEKIFERFYRSDSSRARATGGYGLGLSIAKSVSEAHKIKVEVTCEEGSWITFTLLFPPQKK